MIEMFELSTIDLAIFGVLCLVVGDVVIVAGIWIWNRIDDIRTSLVRPDFKSQLQSALGKKE